MISNNFLVQRNELILFDFISCRITTLCDRKHPKTAKISLNEK